MAGLVQQGRLGILAAALALLTPLCAWPHSGGLDSYGCHHDRKRGGYHCHQGEFAGQSFTSKEEMLRRLRKPRSQAPTAPVIVTVSDESSSRAFPVRVVRVVDGDTIRVCCIQGLEEPVRYIGVNTPELHHPTRGEEPGGREAAEVNRRLVGGQIVRLELDVQERDPYRRVLAYVWIERAGESVMVNAELLRLGYAQVMTIQPNVRHAELFLKLQREAREAGRGLWAP